MEDRNLKYANVLSRMIQKETVSERDQKDLTKFYEFHDLLRELFPNIFGTAEFECFDGSILLKWKGQNPEALPVLFMNHHDVVEAQGQWKHEPFSGEIAEGKVWGRGAIDTKGGLWGMLTAADELAAEGFVPACDIYFESGCNEETTGFGAKKISEALLERGVKFSMVLDEGGMIMFEPIGGAKATYAMVGMGERGAASLKFIAKGKGGHASAPEADTPLVRLGRFMAEADKMSVFDVQLTPVIKEMLRRLAPSIGGALKSVYANPDLFEPILKKVMTSSAGTSRALIQTTIAFTMAEGSDGYNVIPAEASVVGNMRVSNHQGYESSLKAISELAAKFDIETLVLEDAIDSPLADYESEGFKLIEGAIDNAFDDVKVAPYIMTGASDARWMAKLCDNCFHFVPFIISKEQMEAIHGINESVDVETLAPAVDFYKYLYKNVK